MATAIVQIIASILSWAAAKGIDNIVGKWVACVVIAFEKAASEKARVAFSETMERLKEDLPKKSKSWQEWRKGQV